MKYLLVFILVAAVALLLIINPTGKKKELEAAKDSEMAKELENLSVPVEQASVVSIETQFKAVQTALEAYYTEKGEYPETLAALVPQYVQSPSGLADPWGTAINMEKDEYHNVTLVSAGPDKVFSTADDMRRKIE